MSVFRRLRRRMAIAGFRGLAKLSGYSEKDAVMHALQHAFRSAMGDRNPVTPAHLDANRSWVFAANRQIGGRAIRVKPTLHLMSRTASGKVVQTEIFDHPVLDLLSQPNLDETGRQWHYTAVLHLNTGGRAYVLVEPDRLDLSALGVQGLTISRIARLKLLEPDRVRLGSLPERAAAVFDYQDPFGQPQMYPAAPATPAERETWRRDPYPFVIRVFFPAPNSRNGAGPVDAAEFAIDAMQGMNVLWRNQLRNGLHAGLLFLLKKGGFEDIKRFEEAVAMVKTGVGKAGEPLVLPASLVDVTTSPAGMHDMQFAELSTLVRQEVLAVMGASDGVVGIAEAYNRANIDGIERIMALGTVDPINLLIADALNGFLLPLYPGQSGQSWYELSYGTAAATDEVVQQQILTGYVGGPILTPNEGRAKIGMPPVEGGDMLGKPAAPAPAGGGGFGLFGPGAQGRRTEGERAERDRPPCGCGKHGRKYGRDQREEPARAPSRTPSHTWVIKASHPLANPEARHARWLELAATRRVAEAALRRDLAVVFKAWKAATLATLEANGPEALIADARALSDRRAIEPPDEPLAPQTDWNRRLADAWAEWARKYADAVIDRVLQDAGLPPAVELPTDVYDKLQLRVDRWIADRAPKMGTQVGGTQAALIQKTVADAVAESVPLSTMSDQVGAAFPTANSSPLRLIAATEAVMATGNAVFAAGHAAEDAQVVWDGLELEAAVENDGDLPERPDPLGLQWLSRRDDIVRETHVIADGQVVALGERFRVGDCEMRFPGDSELCGDLAEIANCRCEAVVVPLEQHPLPPHPLGGT